MSTPTTRGKYRKLALGEGLQTWGLSNGLNGLFDQMDAALHGHNLITLSSTSYTLTSTNYTVSDINYRFVKFAGTPGGTATITIPATENWWLIQNSTGETLTFSNGANSASITGTSAFYGIVVTDGSAVSVLTLPDGVNVATVAPQVSNGNIASIAAQIANSNIPNLAAAAVITSMNALSPQAVRDDMALLAVQDVIDDMALLGVQTIIDDMAALAVTSVLTDMSLLSPAGVRSDMAALAVTAVINNMAAINTGTVISDLAAIAAGTVRTDMAAINSGTAIADMALISPAAVRTNMAAINTGTVIADMAAIVAGTVRADMAAINTGTVIADIGAVANITAAVSGVNAIASDVTAVNTNPLKQSILDVDSNATNINSLAGLSATITAVNANSANITAVNTDPLKSNINTTAGAVTNVNNVGTNISSVNSVASNMASVNSFGNTYQISTNNPTTGGDGSSSLADGMLAWVTSADKLRVYNASNSAWEDAGSAVSGLRQIYQYVATANQTVFPASGSISYDQTAGGAAISIFLNGVLLKTTDYTATNGTSITLASGAALNDEVTIHTFGTFNAANTYTQAETNTLLAAKAPLASPTFTGTLASPTINASTALQIGGVAISASAAELNYNGVTTLGTTEASKTVTADANGVVTFDNGKIEESTAITSSSNAATINLRDGDNFTHTLSENVTYTFSNPAANGKVSAFTLKVTQDSTARTITWPTSVDWAAATAPTLSTDSGAIDVFVFTTYDGGTTYYGFTAGQAMG